MYTSMRISLVYVYILLGIFSSGEKNETNFVPTREWQVVKTGTPIPRGLHVRHNFQTGVTEAKLMEKGEVEYDSSNNSSDNSKTELWAVDPDKSLLQSNGDKSTQITSDNINQRMKFSIDELKAHLKTIKQNNIKSHSSADQKDDKSYQNYSDLNRKFENLSIHVTNDAELLNKYFQQFDAYRNSITTGTLTVLETEKVLDILSNLEYLIHQIDNAHMFTDLNGISMIILPCVNGTNIEIKSEALRLLGAAAQSNPKVQGKALESEFVQKLLYILSTSNAPELSARSLFALSALVRHFPAAQKSLIDHGGPEVFGKILTDGQIQIQLKVLKLINDLAIERQDLKRIDDPEERQKKENDYITTHFEEKLLLHNYCDQLNSLFIGKYAHVDQFNSEQYDFLETISESLMIFHPMCKDQYQNDKNNLILTVNNIMHLCKNSMSTADEDEVDRLKDLQLMLSQLQTKIVHVNDVPRDEL